MTWSPSFKHFRSPDGSPQSYRRILHPADKMDNESEFFSGSTSPTFARKTFRDVWDESRSPNRSFGDRPRLFKRVFTPDRWNDDDFERTRNSVRQLARDFSRDFDTRNTGREFEDSFLHQDRGCKSQMEDEFEKASDRVHHIPIVVERRFKDIHSKFGRDNDDEDELNDLRRPEVQRLKKSFEDRNFPSNKHMEDQMNPFEVRTFTSPTHSKWDLENVHTLPTRKSGKAFKIYDDHPTGPKSVFRSCSETHPNFTKPPQQTHAAAFRSHSDGHCPKTTYVTKISVNVNPENKATEADAEKESRSQGVGSDNDCNTNSDFRQNRQNKFARSENTTNFPNDETDYSNSSSSKQRTQSDELQDTFNKKDEEIPPKWTSLQQIAAVMKNVEDLFIHVDSYSGSGRDKQYRFLDEMLTRCMLRLDDVDTEGKEDVRTARKTAVMQVQACIEKLEEKADESERQRCAENAENLHVTNLDCPSDLSDSRDSEKSSLQCPEDSSMTSNSEQTKL